MRPGLSLATNEVARRSRASCEAMPLRAEADECRCPIPRRKPPGHLPGPDAVPDAGNVTAKTPGYVRFRLPAERGEASGKTRGSAASRILHRGISRCSENRSSRMKWWVEKPVATTR